MNKLKKLVEKIRKYFGLNLKADKVFGPGEREEELKAHFEHHNKLVEFEETHKIRVRILFPIFFIAIIIGGSILTVFIYYFLNWLGSWFPIFRPILFE